MRIEYNKYNNFIIPTKYLHLQVAKVNSNSIVFLKNV